MQKFSTTKLIVTAAGCYKCAFRLFYDVSRMSLFFFFFLGEFLYIFIFLINY